MKFLDNVQFKGNITTNSGSILNDVNKTTSFQENGDIVETTASGKTITTFNEDGSITEVIKDRYDKTIATKITTFDEDGSIREVVS